MLNSGDVVTLHLVTPAGREAGFGRPAVVVTAQRILDAGPNVVQVVPLSTTVREFGSEVTIDPDDDNGLDYRSAAQCQHIRAVSTGRIEKIQGNVGATTLTQIREVIRLILDIA